jgi:hypothetical protein
MLLLHGEGCIPSMRHGGCIVTKRDYVAAFGAQTPSGHYPYLHHGSEAYTLYVQDLYTRIHMQDGENVVDLPWHFARGLLEEECGNPVNWMQMAYNRMLKGCAKQTFSNYVHPL